MEEEENMPSVATSAIVSAKSIVQPTTVQKKRWGSCWSFYWCFGSHKNNKRIGHVVLVLEPVAPRAAVSTAENVNNLTGIVMPFIAPPSSPVSFLQLDPPSATQSPAGLQSLTAQKLFDGKPVRVTTEEVAHKSLAAKLLIARFLHCHLGIGCPAEMYQKSGCTLKADCVCDYNCSSCNSVECFSNCSSHSNSDAANGSKNERNIKIRSDFDELKIRRARMFNYEELERATGGFKEESVVGKGSFSCVYIGVLKDGTVVAFIKAIISSDKQKNSKEFRTVRFIVKIEPCHLLNLLGYCEEGGERLLFYEFMAHGSLHQHLHGKNKALKEQWNFR
ncbi:Serine/threonine-protein kinase GCN2 isoform 1 [Hibiscus syriacus]|uniref:Serine/threonine-protein kinase GCN2 isoform 1 n=1 Tax=Hibiscus syriacus TaxID=106335 RepID=A0A6A3AMM8_HIBSY|nr:Serine/threonine-protein kinase GCN2 isoform 1 [Hibiscus syriacus]